MRRFLLIVPFCVLMIGELIGQSIHSYPPMMMRMLKNVEAQERLNIFVKADSQLLEERQREGRLAISGEVEGYTLLSISKNELSRLMNEGALSYLDAFHQKGMPLNDRMLLNNNVLPVHQGIFPLAQGYDGAGVIMGVIDTGVELSHPDFLDEEGKTRVLGLWDMTFEVDPDFVPEDYGYGSVWTGEEIDDGLAMLHVDQPSWFGHGSTVTGSACSDGSAINEYKGVAPASEMAIVSFDFDRPDFLPSVAQSVHYLIGIADDADLPIVINASLGTYYGSHDGLDPTALYIDSLLDAQTGRLFVCAAGNSQNIAPYHLRTELETDTSFTWFQAENGLGDSGPGVFFEVWAEIDDFDEVEFSMSADDLADDTVRSVAIGQWFESDLVLGDVVSDTLWNDSGDFIGVVDYWAQQRGEQYQLQVFMPQVDSSQFVFRFSTRGTGAFDVWTTSTFGSSDMIQTNLPDSSVFPDIEHYTLPDNDQHMVSSWACSEKVTTVANYINRSNYTDYLGQEVELGTEVGAIVTSSSSGPTRTGLQKPDVAASGTIALSSGDFDILAILIANEPHKVAQGGMHHRNGGTSMASPVVAGVGALFLQQCPEANWSYFQTALSSTAVSDLNTGQLPNTIWGHGKVNTYGALSSLAVVAEVELQGDDLVASLGDSYQWYLNGEIISGATGQQYQISGAGEYMVEVFNLAGCSDFSEPFLITGLEEEEAISIEVLNSPGQLFISGLVDDDILVIRDLSGKEVLRSEMSSPQLIVETNGYAQGIYTIELSRVDKTLVEKVLIKRP